MNWVVLPFTISENNFYTQKNFFFVNLIKYSLMFLDLMCLGNRYFDICTFLNNCEKSLHVLNILIGKSGVMDRLSTSYNLESCGKEDSLKAWVDYVSL